MWTSNRSSSSGWVSPHQAEGGCPLGTPVAQCSLSRSSTLADTGSLGAGQVLLVALLVTLILVSVVGNCLVCVAIFTDRRLRKLGNAFIVSLAIADLFVSCLVMTFALCNDLMNRWIFGEWFCDVWISFDIMCCTASILNLCAISLDRFVHIKDCLLYNQLMTRRVAISAVMVIWFISGLVSFVPINLGWHKPSGGGGGGAGQLSKPLEGPQAAAWQTAASLMAPLQPHLPNTHPVIPSASRMATKLDYLRHQQQEQALVHEEEPIEKQSSLLVDSGRSRRRRRRWQRRHDAEKHWQQPATGLKERTQATQFNQVESNPLDGSQIIRAHNNSVRRLQHLHPETSTSHLVARHLHEPALLPEPPPPPLPNLGRPSGPGNHQPQTPDSWPERPQAPPLAPPPPPPQCVLTLTPTYAVVSSTISFCIPCIIMLALYSKLFACARKHVRNIQAFTKVPAPISAPNAATADTCSGGREPSPAPTSGENTQQRSDSASSSSVAAYRATRTWLKLAKRRPPQTQTTTTTTTTTCTGANPPPEVVSPESRPFLHGATCKQPASTSLQPNKQPPPPSQGSQLATHKAAVTLGIIMGTFLFCWVPFFCLNIIKAFCVDCIPSSLFRAFTWLGYANSALNPIIYGIHNTEFRNAFSWIFFRHLNIKKSGERLAAAGGIGLPNNNIHNNNIIPATSKRTSGSLQLRQQQQQQQQHRRKRPAAARQNSAPQSSAQGPPKQQQLPGAPQQLHLQAQLQLNEANNQCSASPEL